MGRSNIKFNNFFNFSTPKLGLVGVAIGTLISVLIRGIEMTIFATKKYFR